MWPFGRKDYKLFDLFNLSANVVVRASIIVRDIVNDYEDLDDKMKQLMALEDEGDQIIEELVQKLNQSFVLPFDREDAYAMVQKLDSILDYLAGIVDRIILYKAVQLNTVVCQLADVLHQAIILMETAFNMLLDFENKRKEIMECCDLIMELERKGDSLYRQAMADLFQGDHDAMTVIKWKEIYEHIESTLDRCEDVGNLVRGICIKYS
ncbi:MAG: DUF47 domain-containing protein [Firmicutes bacterium]|nr:DUF47 domain-containing protein [Bacillota bacterium]